MENNKGKEVCVMNEKEEIYKLGLSQQNIAIDKTNIVIDKLINQIDTLRKTIKFIIVCFTIVTSLLIAYLMLERYLYYTVPPTKNLNLKSNVVQTSSNEKIDVKQIYNKKDGD